MLKRTKRELRILESAKKRSLRSGDQEKTILKGVGRREFFRIENGKVVEYDLSHLNGVAVELTEEEQYVVRNGAY